MKPKEHPIEAGFGCADITPEKDRQTIYHKGPRITHRDEETPIRDRLYARATAFRWHDRMAVIMSVDICVLPSHLRTSVSRALAPFGVPRDHLCMASTHTHTAPTGLDFGAAQRIVAPMKESTWDWLRRQCARAAQDAIADLAPARLSFGRSNVQLGVNRRQVGRLCDVNSLEAPTGTVDPQVAVLLVERDARRDANPSDKAYLFNYAAHPLTMTERVPQISADYPGQTIADLTTVPAVIHAQFIQGCGADVNPRIHGDTGECRMVGLMLADGVRTALKSAQPVHPGPLRIASRTVALPLKPVPGMNGAPDAIEAPVQALRVGNVVFVALPGEVFVEIGLELKAKCSVPNLIVSAYANKGEVGYIPTASAFPEGGYEVESAPGYYGSSSPFLPECGQALISGALDVIHDVLG